MKIMSKLNSSKAQIGRSWLDENELEIEDRFEAALADFLITRRIKTGVEPHPGHTVLNFVSDNSRFKQRYIHAKQELEAELYD